MGCLPAQLDEAWSVFLKSARAAVVDFRAEDRDPWERSNGPGPDPEAFRRDVLSVMRNVSAAKLAELTGLSRNYCMLVLRGERVPHPTWWAPMSQFGSAPTC